MKRTFMVIALLLGASCSIAPFNSTKTARTLGDANWEIDSGLSPALYFSASRGFGENFDGGVTFEGQASPVLGVSGKYAFINAQEKGFSLSGLGGLFLGQDIAQSSGFYIGPVLSYKLDWFEPYLVTRYNWVKWNGQDLSGNERDDLFVDLVSFDDVEHVIHAIYFRFQFLV